MVGLGLGLLLTAGCGLPSSSPSTAGPPSASTGSAAPGSRAAEPGAAGAASTTALATLEQLPVKGRAAATGYSREQFGQAWADTDRNGCDTRNDILRRDLHPAKTASSGCTVLSGVLKDPYTGNDLAFRRGPDTSADVQIDHVVALANAWVTGGQRLSPTERTALANDPLNLLATTGSVNQSKGAGDAATWLPPRKAERCAYAARQIAVKHTYRLWVTRAEHDALVGVLMKCPTEPLPGRAEVTPPPRVS